MAGLDKNTASWLKSLLGESVLFDEPMVRHTSFRVGGPVDALAIPGRIETLVELVEGLRSRNIPHLVVGAGTNLLVKDAGIRGVAIMLKNALDAVGEDGVGGAVKAQAGAGMNRLCGFALRKGLAGMNFALGIPGTVGGAIAMNAGTSLGQVGDVLKKISVLTPDGRVLELKREMLRFTYRKLIWEATGARNESTPSIILEGVFNLTPDDPAKLKKQAMQIVKRRWKSQPSWLPSAGCFFKNPPSAKPAGMLIDLAGLKGVSRGGAQISPVHANFIVNRKNASARDVLYLKDLVQETVKKKFNVDLEPEVKIVGD